MNKKEKFYPETRFGGYTDIDGTIIFYNRINSLISPTFVVLDVGCGKGGFSSDPVIFRKNLMILKGKVKKVIGIDIDKNAQVNPFIDEFRLIESPTWPIEDNSIDLIVCNFVLEHIENPTEFFSEIQRVLRNGGFLCIRTLNLFGYIALAAKIIPNKYHSKVTTLVQESRKEDEVFPTVYKCNSFSKLKKYLKSSGFDYVVYGYEAEPSYLSFSTIAYFFGVLYQRYAPSFLKNTLLAFGKIHKENS